MLQVSSSVVVTGVPRCFSSFSLVCKLFRTGAPLSIWECGRAFCFVLFFFIVHTQLSGTKRSAVFRSKIHCNKNNTETKVILEYWITNRDSLLEHFEQFCFGDNSSTWAKIWKACSIFFHRKSCCLTMWKYYLLCHIVKHIFFLFCKKWLEASFLPIYPTFVIPQGKDWGFSNILKKGLPIQMQLFLAKAH